LFFAASSGTDPMKLAEIPVPYIGKMAIPDRVLLKPGPLTRAEWDIMRQHPVYAYKFISPIKYLRPAIDIPYCHHEKVDGTCYPRGLAGKDIPFAAQIFAVVDVWDALTSNRPYRKAWSKNRTSHYIQKRVGRHFVPKVVEAFLDIDPLGSWSSLPEV